MFSKLINTKIEGDKIIWFVTLALLLGSFLAVFSTSAISRSSSSVTTVFMIYFAKVCVAITLMILSYKIDYKYYKALSWLGIFGSIFLLIAAITTGRLIGGQIAARWVYVGPFSFQPSSFAIIAVVVFTARYLDKLKNEELRPKFLKFKNYSMQLWLWVGVIFFLIAPFNLSTGILLAMVFYGMLFLGNYPIKHILITFLAAGLMFGAFFMLAKINPDMFKATRFSTWESRIETFISGDKSADNTMQQQNARMAVALGIVPQGPGKSVQKYFLPHSDSDFIFSVLVEEYSFMGGLFIIVALIFLAIRSLVYLPKTDDYFAKYLISGLVLLICVQGILHIAVNLDVIPVTGQNLPFISSGGTAAMASCVCIGIIQSVIRSISKKPEEKENIEQETLAGEQENDYFDEDFEPVNIIDDER